VSDLELCYTPALDLARLIAGRRHGDLMVLRIGQALEAAIGWPAWRPPLEVP